ncbi:hypothetical protein OAI94_00960 [bacterium]|nr:hypothetical protein [bacterium]
MKNQNKYLLRKRVKVLNLAKNIIVKRGLTSQTLKITAKEFGLDSDEVELLFPNGKNDLVQFTLDQLNNELEEFCKKN